VILEHFTLYEKSCSGIGVTHSILWMFLCSPFKNRLVIYLL